MHSLASHGKCCSDIENACLVEYILGHLPTHKPWAMPNLIPIDFYAEGKPNTIYPLGCMQYCFSGKCDYMCLGHKGHLRGGQPNGFGHSVHKTQLSQSIILELSVLRYTSR